MFTSGVSWSGFGAFVGVLPIPLAIPTGRYETRLYVREDKVVGKASEYGEITNAFGYMCGSNECGFVAGPVNSPEIAGDPSTWCR